MLPRATFAAITLAAALVTGAAFAEPVTIETPRTLADGAQTTHLGQLTFPIIQRDVNDILTVSDEELVACMRFFAERMKMVVEPTGCLAFAAACAAWPSASRCLPSLAPSRRSG